MEASGTSGQKASVNGVINFSVLDGWWAEGYDQTNGWTIGTNAEFTSYEEQDKADSESLYNTLENKIIPLYYENRKEDLPEKWIEMMKNSIITTGGKYSTSRMVVDYTKQMYIPLCNLYNNYYSNLENVSEYTSWKSELYNSWNKIEIKQLNNLSDITMDAGNNINVGCEVKLPNINVENIEAEVYYGKIKENGMVDDISIIPMNLVQKNEEEHKYIFEAKIELTTGGDYGYTFRVMPKHEMLLESSNLNLVKWITQ